jgi:Rha family phage regulatory protein
MSALVRIMDGEARTTSLAIADHFGKRHDSVLRAAKDVLEHRPDQSHNFVEMIQDVPVGKGAVRQSRYLTINRDGFMLLAMGFTGKKAIDLKLAFIAAFNRYEEIARGETKRVEMQRGLSTLLQNPHFATAEARDAGWLAVSEVRRMARMKGEAAAFALWKGYGLPVPEEVLAIEHAPPEPPKRKARVWEWADACGVKVSVTVETDKLEAWHHYVSWATAQGHTFDEPPRFFAEVCRTFNIEGRRGIFPIEIGATS